MKDLKRSNKQYVEVEEFADYELTQCIAYEMAIRNEKWIILSRNVVTFYAEHKDSINYYLNDKEENFDFDKWEKGSDNFNKLIFIILDIEVIEKLKGYEEYPFLIEQSYKSPKLGNDFWDIFSIMLQDFIPDEKVLDNKYAQLIHQKAMSQIQLIKNIKRNGYTVEIILYSDDEECHYPIDDGEDDGEEGRQVNSILEYAKFVEARPYNVKSKIGIEESFKRPKIQNNILKTIEPTLTINLNRPLDELIAQITHIKQDMEQNNLDKLPIELLGIELTRGDNLVCNEKGEKCFDPRSILSKQQKMADMFYIYDCLKLGYSQSKIRNEIYNYYADKGMEISLDPATLRKYRDIAKDYIDNKKYKEMLTGISIDDLEKM